MAIRTYRYIGNPYPPETGILLPGVSVVLFPVKMPDVEIKLLTDEFPHLRRFWEKGAFDDGEIPTDDTGNGNGTGGGGNPTFREHELEYLLAELKAQMPKLTFLSILCFSIIF